MSDLGARFAAYLQHRWPQASSVEVETLERIYGGASRETYRVTVRTIEGGRESEQRLILRRDPPSSLIETDRATEYRAYEAFYGTRVPGPAPALPRDRSALARPAVLRHGGSRRRRFGRRGCSRRSPTSTMSRAIGEQKWRILGEIARSDPGEVSRRGSRHPRSRVAGGASSTTGSASSTRMSSPRSRSRARRFAGSAAIRLRLRGGSRSCTATTARATSCSTPQGRIRAILDWEMCHLGDALEDLAWALDPLWSWPDRERPGKLIPRERALAIWQQASGIDDRRACARLVGDLRFGEGPRDLDLVWPRIRRRQEPRSHHGAGELVPDRRARSRARRAARADRWSRR